MFSNALLICLCIFFFFDAMHHSTYCLVIYHQLLINFPACVVKYFYIHYYNSHYKFRHYYQAAKSFNDTL